MYDEISSRSAISREDLFFSRFFTKEFKRDHLSKKKLRLCSTNKQYTSLQADDNEVVATAVPVTASEDNVRNLSLLDGEEIKFSQCNTENHTYTSTIQGEDEGKVASKEEQERKELLMMKEPAFAFLGFASFMMLIQASHDCDQDGIDCEGNRAFAVAMAVVAGVVVFLHFAFDLAEHFKMCGRVQFWDDYVEPFLALGLWVWWGVGAFILTFTHHKDAGTADAAPWEAIGTGWLMTWAGVFTTTALLYPEFLPAWRGLQERFPFLKKLGVTDGHSFEYILGLLIASFVVFIEAADICEESDCEEERGWAFTVSLVSLIGTLVLFATGRCVDASCPIVLKIAATGLPIMWFCGISVICVDGPFEDGQPANGFFGSYAAFVFSVLICLEFYGMIGEGAKKN